eukprot:m.88750 g.88750  ORF g.88750 m.88750 type:complete len:269 (+) comp14953_c0_seq3:1847-2653(+)
MATLSVAGWVARALRVRRVSVPTGACCRRLPVWQYHRQHRLHTSAVPGSSQSVDTAASMVDAPPGFVAEDMVVYPNVITEHEEEELLREVEPALRRCRYEQGHWDRAITNYREVFRSRWKRTEARAIVQRLVSTSPLSELDVSPSVHVLDLAADGEVLPHVDSNYAGPVVTGLSLMSDSVMELHPVERGGEADSRCSDSCDVQSAADSNTGDGDGVVRVLLPRRSLYVMQRTARYNFTHSVPCLPDLTWHGTPVIRQRRVVLLWRNEP